MNQKICRATEHPQPIVYKHGLKFATLNVRGLNSPYKTSSLVTEAHSFKADILFIQEIHFAASKIPCLILKQFPTLLLALNAKKENGDLTAVWDTVNFHLYSEIADPHGRFHIIIYNINQSWYTLVNVYGPNS